MSIFSAAKSPNSAPESKPLGILRWIAVLFIAVIALVVRLFCLACKPFWFDEAFSVEVARVTWGNFLHLLWWREANMSLYYLLLRVWLHCGQSSFFVRSLSALIAAATVPAIYWVASLLYDRRTGLIAAALLAFNAYHVRYAQEARSYTLFALLATLSSGFLIVFLQRPTKFHRRAYIIISVLAAYAHFYAVLLIVAQWMALRSIADPSANTEHGNAQKEWAVNATALSKTWRALACAVAPILVFVAKTGAGPIKWIKRPSIYDLYRFASDITNGWPIVYLGICLLILVPLGKHLCERATSWEQWRVQFLLLWLLFPIVLTVLLSFARPVFLPRYMIFCLPPLLVLTAAGMGAMKPAWLAGTLAAIVVLLSVGSVPFVYSHDFDKERDASVAASEFVLNHAVPGDAIVFHIAETRIPYEFVRSSRLKENTASPHFDENFGPGIVFPEHGPGLDYRDFTGKPTPGLLRAQLPNHPRVWVMLMNNGGLEKPDPTTIMISQVIPQMFPKMEQWQFAKVEVRLYSR